MNIPKDLKYTKTHEWVKVEDGKARVGITDYAQKEISDIVFIELPKAGSACQKEEPRAVVESVKAAFDIYAPLSGKILAVNESLESDPGVVNASPYDNGWLFDLELSDPAEAETLMDAAAYEAHIETEKAKH